MHSRLRISHTRTVRSSLALASRFPSGLKSMGVALLE
jgi:hypothetical protein